MVWYSLEAPHRGTPNEYPQHVFIRNKKKICDNPLISGAMIKYKKHGVHFTGDFCHNRLSSANVTYNRLQVKVKLDRN